MKTAKKKSHIPEKMEDDFVRKPVKKMASKRDRKISIYNPTDEDDEAFENFDELLDFDPDDFEEEDEDDF
ncbi:MAG: hypothetical protein KJ578_14390 [Bacteroidetes bacterium]|jgi:hypothetical protein|nr:hypothetical protein [Bacteroidota bacterium]MDA3944702.1 hypothetical protein [Bacteroidota bacterium]